MTRKIKIVNEPTPLAELLKHEDEAVRRFGLLMVGVEPVMMAWIHEMEKPGCSLGEILQHAANMAVTIGATMVVTVVPEEHERAAMRDFINDTIESLNEIGADLKPGTH